ncbi:helix-turn-helix domain-containing protein [Streptomyces sp. NPDC048442]|uniref:helix-turn-helix domain-containing protein n=1 Tax=Streptomyces sp. NPDC048442 TaxID=3154823 RepID=UPI00342952B5
MGLKKNDRPVDDADREAVRVLHAEGHGRNEIARRTGRSGHTISDLAADLGLTFDRAATAVATQARVIDSRARRAAIVARLYDVAEDDLDYLTSVNPYPLVEVSMGAPVRYDAERLPAQDRKALITGISTATTAAARLEAIDGSPETDSVRSMLLSLADGIQAVAGHQEDTTGEG